MKLKKKVKRTIFIVVAVILLLLIGFIIYKSLPKTEEVKEVKIVNEVDKYDYKLKENKSKKYKELFTELKEILSAKEVDEEKYVSKISQMFIVDFYSLEDKAAKTDVGGVDFIYKDAVENFLINAQDTYYKYVESNIYNDRKQQLPVVEDVVVDDVITQAFGYGEKVDEKAYVVKVHWTYTKDAYSSYQKEAQLVFIHDGIKLCLIELK